MSFGEVPSISSPQTFQDLISLTLGLSPLEDGKDLLDGLDLSESLGISLIPYGVYETS